MTLLRKMIDALKWRLYYPITEFFNVYIARIERAISYAKFGWGNPDWDSSYLYKHIGFKLKRMEYSLETGMSDLTFERMPEVMKALKEAIEICKRLSEENYASEVWLVHDKKWGDYVETENEGMVRANVKTEEDREQERKELFNAFKSEEAERNKDLNRLGVILKDYSSCWWD